jgi:hypothetical protein
VSCRGEEGGETHSLGVSDVREVTGELERIDDLGSSGGVALESKREYTAVLSATEKTRGDLVVRMRGETRVRDPSESPSVRGTG